MPVSIVPGDTIPLAQIPTRILVRVERNLLSQIDPSMEPLMETDSFTRTIRKGRSALAHVHHEVSNVLFGADFPRAVPDMGWPKHEANPPRIIGNGYVGFYYNYNVDVGNTNPSVLELTASEELHDNVVVFNSEQLHGDQKELANMMVNNAEAGLAS